ncbi:CRISPR-associated protein, Csm4 family [Methylothermus subterraneus]
MNPLTLTLLPRAAFGSPLKGDTLFGQLCWAVRNRFGEARLAELLVGYTQGRPFAVVSDAFPAGFLPRPALPLYRFRETEEIGRKQVKSKRWIAREDFKRPLADWLALAQSDAEVARRFASTAEALWTQRNQPHNTIHRLTGTTDSGEFAPYSVPQRWYLPGARLEVYLTFDAARIERDAIVDLIADIGLLGYGRDASIGLGKFEVDAVDDSPWPGQENANAFLTLAPCAPQGLGFDPARSWYQPFVRFGRHGDAAVHSGRPFKTPVLLADTGALLTPQRLAPCLFIGQGLGGEGRLSKAISQTVHQGYAPVLPICLEENA